MEARARALERPGTTLRLSLVQHFQIDPPVVRLHDVVRHYLRDRAGERLIADISRDILDLYQDVDLGVEPDDGEPRW